MQTLRPTRVKNRPARVAASASGITLKTPEEQQAMRRAGQVVALVLERLGQALHPGMRTRDLDALAAQMIRQAGAQPAFLGYRGFPAVICVSLNEEIVHGIPGDRIIREGDLVKIDAGAIVDGMYADAARSFPVGKVHPRVHALIEVTRTALEVGIRQARPGAHIGDIGSAIQRYVESRGYAVVREYVGHGIGRALHEDPAVPNYGQPGEGPLLVPGMAIAIEPMVNMGTYLTRVQEDGWTVVTADGTLSAHFEDTVIITATGCEVITRYHGR
ncbi:MAG: type I methionyl aminopeptidase [Dehalococcoidia bacterium]|nr:type I methionyl aminopeptidase [Dehalococcoidia bacterium]MDW8119365.1 type I methionyl aminopeptidase [Chloroflexota bacterium]